VASSDVTKSPLEAAAGTTGDDVIEALNLIAEETRLAILLALWEEYDPHADDEVPFSRLFERTGYDERGNFSYHLEKLKGQFIEQHGEEGGYGLRKPGLKLVRAIIAGRGIEDATLKQTPIDRRCSLCGAATAVSYRDGILLWSCTECEGIAPDEIDTAGALGLVEFDPAGLDDRSAEELYAASRVATHQSTRSMFNGLCPACSGTVDQWLDHCEAHNPMGRGICDHCGHPSPALAHFQCTTCEKYCVAHPASLALFHPQMVAFYATHGISTRIRTDDFERARQVDALVDDHDQDVIGTSPLRVRVTATLGDEAIRLIFDERVNVVDVQQ